MPQSRRTDITKYASLIAAVTLSAGSAGAETPQKVRDVQAAIALIAKEQEAAKAEGRPIKAGRLAVTWEYGAQCSDAASLIPPPMAGWGPLNDVSLGEWPIAADNASIAYSFVDESLDPASPDYGASRQTVSVRVTSDSASAKGLEQFLSMPAMRSAMFEDGPFGYPVQKYAMSTLVGPYMLQVDGYGDQVKDYFKEIIACAIRSGLIANGVDAAGLADPDAPAAPPQ